MRLRALDHYPAACHMAAECFKLRNLPANKIFKVSGLMYVFKNNLDGALHRIFQLST
jgi:hypothetical protein